MTSQDTIRSIIAESLTMDIPAGTRRDGELPTIPGRATILIGMRRSGKTYRLYQRMRELLDQGVPRRNMLVVDFEDTRLDPCERGLIEQVVEAYETMVPRGYAPGKRYLFFDEVQNVPEWGRSLRQLLQTQRFEIYATGSSAKMLSKELVTEFRGRSVSHDVLPFSFREFLRHRGLEPNDHVEALAMQTELAGQLERYLAVGGFPEVQDINARTRVRALQDLVGGVVARDIVDRYDLPPRSTTAFVTRALRHSARAFSVNKVYNELKAQHVPISKDLAYSVPGYCEDAYLFFTIGQAATSVTKGNMGTRKLYAIDPGLQRATAVARADDLGLALKDAVFVELMRRHGVRDDAVTLYRSGANREVDFVAGDEMFADGMRLIQVTAQLDPSTEEGRSTIRREEGSLIAAMDENDVEHGLIIAASIAPGYVPSDRRIVAVRAWQWFLGSS